MRAIDKIIPKHTLKMFKNLKETLFSDRKTQVGLLIFTLFGAVYITSKISESDKIVYRDHQRPIFKEGRILGGQTSSYLKNKEMQLSKIARQILAKNNLLEEKLKILEQKVEVKL